MQNQFPGVNIIGLDHFLSNIVLDELDKALEKRGLGFIRSIENRLRPKVNREKRVISHPLNGGITQFQNS